MRAGKHIQQLQEDLSYQAFMPNFLPPKPPIKIDKITLDLLSKADRFLKGIMGSVEGIMGSGSSIQVLKLD